MSIPKGYKKNLAKKIKAIAEKFISDETIDNHCMRDAYKIVIKAYWEGKVQTKSAVFIRKFLLKVYEGLYKSGFYKDPLKKGIYRNNVNNPNSDVGKIKNPPEISELINNILKHIIETASPNIFRDLMRLSVAPIIRRLYFTGELTDTNPQYVEKAFYTIYEKLKKDKELGNNNKARILPYVKDGFELALKRVQHHDYTSLLKAAYAAVKEMYNKGELIDTDPNHIADLIWDLYQKLKYEKYKK